MLLPLSKWDLLIRMVRVTSYIPGRIRFYSNTLVGNTERCRQVYAHVASYKEIDSVEVNAVTGSVLIQYRPAVLRANPELARVEIYVNDHVERRR